MDFKPVCLRVTFCNARILVSVSPFKTILDLKKEVSRVYRLHYPEKTEECKHIQDNNGYLVCDDYQVGLVFSNSETVFALTATQPIDKYSGQWQDVGDSSKSHRAADNSKSKQHFRQSCVESSTKGTSLPVPTEKNHKQGGDETSETDCSNDLPQRNRPTPSDKKQVDNPNLTIKNLQDKRESNEKLEFTDSSLSDSDSDMIPSKTPGRRGRTVEDQPKSTPKKKRQDIVTTAESSDKTKDSTDIRRSLGQKFKLAIDANNSSTPQAAETKRFKAKRKQHPSDDGQGTTASEKKAKKKLSKKELELANASSQSMILDNEKLWS